MKRIIFLILICLGINFSAFAQESAKELPDECFWFFVKLSNSVNPQSRVKCYSMRRISTKIYSGNKNVYQRQLWKGISLGTQIAVGPFFSYKDAQNAIKLYDQKSDAMLKDYNSDTYYWFLTKVNILQRSHSYQFEHMAARVASGTAQEFHETLVESLNFNSLAIGIFPSIIQAENAKNIYRIEE